MAVLEFLFVCARTRVCASSGVSLAVRVEVCILVHVWGDPRGQLWSVCLNVSETGRRTVRVQIPGVHAYYN